MDESWRMRMGSMPTLPRRRSTENASIRSVFAATTDSQTLDPDDFADVFGGPPRSVLPHQFSGRSTTFYEEIFRPPEFGSTADKSGRSLPAFRIPARSEGFYSDIFGSDDEGLQRRSRERSRPNSKAKSNSSSVLSSEELSPLRPVIGDDVALSSFASKLRPLNVPCRWNSSTMRPTKEEQHYNSKKQGMEALHCNQVSLMDHQNVYDERLMRSSSYFGFTRNVLSPETISLEPNSYRSVKLSVDDLELNSPSSAVSSICQEHEIKCGIENRVFDLEKDEEEEEEEDEVMSSYVIEINSEHREGACEEAAGIEEAIAWAKEKFQIHSNNSDEKEGSLIQQQDNEQSIEMDEGRHNLDEYSDHHQQSDEQHERTQSPEEDQEERTWITQDEKQHSEKDIETELLDEDIRLWSTGRESNIRLLLSTLHQIVWPNSGWYAIPLTSLIESSQVKKAYQKARLCLHPDKLQQRGATLAQKYLAQKAFSILQDAWALFISQDVFII